MSIYIPGMELPKSCAQCPFATGIFCSAKEEEPHIGWFESHQTKPDFCPLVEGPPHGRLIVLPCKVGDTVYRIQYIDQDEIGVARYVVGIAETKFRLLLLDEYGKTVFLTREEAEAALRKEADNG